MNRTLSRRLGAALGVLALAAAVATPASARPARCFTTDDGEYACDFQPSGDGSFTISAPGKPTFTLTIDSPGVAFGSAVFEPGGRSVALPGQYHRSTDDPGCWVNDATSTKICAW